MSDSSNKSLKHNSGFGPVRGVLWPIHGYELKKFLPMALMMFCVLFNYSVLRNTKDSLVVNAKGSGAEALAFIKLYCVTPVAILLMLGYAKLSNVLRPEKLFYVTLSPFLIFFALFALVIYPNIDLLHMNHEKLIELQNNYHHLKWFLAVIGNWSFALFYMLSEFWGSIVLSLLFWQFANQITRTTEAKRFYSLFGLIGNFGLILAGVVIYNFSKSVSWSVAINWLMGFTVVSGLGIMAIYWWMNRNVLTDPKYYDEFESARSSKGSKKEKPKMPISDSLKYIFTSKYLGCIAILMIGYGVSINLIEGVWKSQMKIQFPNNSDYNAFMGLSAAYTGVVTVILMLVGSNITRIFSWLTSALITPVMMLVTSLIFFSLIIYSNYVASSPFDLLMGNISFVYAAVIVGVVQNILTKSTKYSLFDPTKEMTYIPLDQELKVKGKAAVDVIGGRLGKGGGAFVQSTLLLIFSHSTLPQLAPALAVILVIIVLLWILAVFALSKKFAEVSANKAKEEGGRHVGSKEKYA